MVFKLRGRLLQEDGRLVVLLNKGGRQLLLPTICLKYKH